VAPALAAALRDHLLLLGHLLGDLLVVALLGGATDRIAKHTVAAVDAASLGLVRIFILGSILDTSLATELAVVVLLGAVRP